MFSTNAILTILACAVISFLVCALAGTWRK